MNVRSTLNAPQTADDFLRWNEGREGRREFVHGRIVEMMVGVSRSHVRLASRLTLLIGSRLDPEHFDFGTADFGIRTAAGIRYPGFFVDTANGTPGDLAATTPLLVAEILSPSSRARDFGEKATDYTAIPSLLHSLVLSQDEPRVWLWSRTDGVFGEPAMLVGAEAVLPLVGFDLTLALAEIYRGIA
jgi:Uma2 family endonuclease